MIFKYGIDTLSVGKVLQILNGELKAKITITVDAASQSAKTAVEKAGGTLNITSDTSEKK